MKNIMDSLLEYVKEDLFSSATSLCHCVSSDFHMSAGIATTFKKKFGHQHELKLSNVKIGNVAVLKNKDRCIYYLVTKQYYYEKPTMKSLRSCLEKMCKHAVEEGIDIISMPRIGCGLDKLKWNEVEKLLHEVFSESNIKIKVYSLK